MLPINEDSKWLAWATAQDRVVPSKCATKLKLIALFPQKTREEEEGEEKGEEMRRTETIASVKQFLGNSFDSSLFLLFSFPTHACSLHTLMAFIMIFLAVAVNIYGCK